MICPNDSCKTEYADGEKFCVNCGLEFKPQSGQEVSALDTASSPAPATNDPPAQVEQAPPDPAALEEMKFNTAPSYPVTVTVSGLTHPGLRGKNNEDAVVSDKTGFPGHDLNVSFVIVSDGMGGEQAGEILSKLAVYDIAAGFWFLMPSFEISEKVDNKLDFWRLVNNQFAQFLTNQVASANSRVVRYGKAKKLRTGHFGATVVAAVVITDMETGHVMVYGFNAGDARCYLVSDDKVDQLSTDHVLPQMVSGHLVNSPSQFLGAYDHLTGRPFVYETWMSEANQNTLALVLCTDGGWNMIGPDPLPGIIKECDTAQLACETLLSKSLNVEVPYGRQFDPRTTTGDDNITYGVVKISREEAK